MTGAKAMALEEACRARWQAFIRFDYQGHGQSGGDFALCSIGLWLEDALAVIDGLSTGPVLLVGSSMGGWLALLASLARPNRVKGLVAVAPATDFTERLLWPNLGEVQQAAIMREGSIRIPSPYDIDGYPITRLLIEEGRGHLLLDGRISLDIPIRLLHGMQDDAVPWRHSLKLIECLASADVSLTLVKDGDHRLSRDADLALLTAAVAALSDA